MMDNPGRQSGFSILALIGLYVGVSSTVFGLLSVSSGYSYEPLSDPISDDAAGVATTAARASNSGDPTELRELDATRRKLAVAADRRIPSGRYIVIDRGNNRLYLRQGEEVELDAVVSTGSGTILREIGGQGRTWVFDTPPGRHKVRGLRTGPVWTKPDWAFLEDGLPLPASIEERFERGVLGEYALDLGDSYLIHDTLYENLLGRSITHGCIRVGRDDLRVLVEATGLGTPVYIY